MVTNIYTSLQQASEWGMRGLQKTFPWCKKHLPLDNDKYWHVLELIILVHSFQTETIGHDQILALFAPEYKQVINIHD